MSLPRLCDTLRHALDFVVRPAHRGGAWGCGKNEPSESPTPAPPSVIPSPPAPTGTVLWKFETGSVVGSSLAIWANGTVLYVGSHDGFVYAFASSSTGPAKSPWPMRGGNARHTGRAAVK